MKHNLKISVSKKPTEGGVVRCRRVSMRERLLRHFFGEKRRVMVIVPGDSVESDHTTSEKSEKTSNLTTREG